MATFCLATIIRAEIKNVKIIITLDNKSIKMWSDMKSSPLGGRVIKEIAVIQIRARVMEFHSCFLFWDIRNRSPSIGTKIVKIAPKLGGHPG